MKPIYLIHVFIILFIAIVITFINNQYYYKSIEKSTYRTMMLETKQLKETLQDCYQSKLLNCDKYAQSFLNSSNVLAKIKLLKNNQSLLNIDLESYEDDRTPICYSEKCNIDGNEYSISYSQLTTPPILKSVFRSMTFSIFEWHNAAKNGKSTYTENLKSFINNVAIPRSMPALNYTLCMLILFYICWRMYLFAIRKNWDKYEKMILPLNFEIENLQKEKENFTQEKIEHQNKELELSEKNRELTLEIQNLVNKRSEYEALTQDLEEKIKIEKKKYNDQIKYNVGALEAELLSATKKYKDEKNQLLDVQRNIEEKYKNDLSIIDVESNAKIEVYETQLNQLKQSLELLNKKQEELSLDYEISKEELNDQLRVIEEKENIVGKLENEIVQLTDQRNEKMEDQSSLIPNNTKKLILKYLISNPHIKPTNYVEKVKLSMGGHHSKNFVSEIHQYICNHKELSKIIVSVTSCEYKPTYQKSILICHIPRHGKDNTNYKYVAKVISESNGGYSAELLLNSSSDWEAIVHAKMLLLYIKQFKDFTIIDKISA